MRKFVYLLLALILCASALCVPVTTAHAAVKGTDPFTAFSQLSEESQKTILDTVADVLNDRTIKMRYTPEVLKSFDSFMERLLEEVIITNEDGKLFRISSIHTQPYIKSFATNLAIGTEEKGYTHDGRSGKYFSVVENANGNYVFSFLGLGQPEQPEGQDAVGSPVIPPHTHTGGTATCTEPAICAACGQPYGEALGHQEETIPGKAATCTEPGLTDGVKCSVCGAILTAQEEIAALGHDPETIPATATCTQAGLSEYTVCARCGVWLTGPKEIPALGHKEEPVPATEPTCTAPGYSAGVKCSRCGETLSGREETDPALGHDWGGWETVATKDGKVRQQRVCKRDASHVETRTMKGAVDGVEWVEGSEKDDLEKLLKMTPDQIKTLINAIESAMNDLSVKRIVPIFVKQFDNYIERTLDELVHFGSDGNVVMDSATAIKKVAKQIIRTNNFEHTYTGSKYFKVTIAAGGKYHVTYIGPVLVDDDSEWDEWGEWEVTTPATCTEKGEETRVDKKDSNHVETREIPATGHTEEPIPGKAATCTEPGLTDGVKCARCGEVLTAQEEIPALGHDWGEWETVKGEDGLQSQKRRVCKRDSTHTETKPDVGTDVGGSDVTGAPATQIPQDAPELASLPQGAGTLVGAWDIKMSGTTTLTFTYTAMPTGATLHVWSYKGGAWHEKQGNQTGNSITVTVNTH